MTTIAASHIEPVLDDVLDARATNLAEQRLLISSLLEQLIAADERDISTPLRRQLLEACRQAIDLERVEGSSECSAAGRTDDLIRTVRNAQLNHGDCHPLTVKEIGRQLRPALAILKHPERHHRLQVQSARRAVTLVLDRVPAHALFTPSVRKELRDGSYRLLEDHVATRGTSSYRLLEDHVATRGTS